MKKFKITKGDRVYIVDAKSHIDAISKVKAVKGSVIRDYSPEVYVNELEKLIPEYIKLDKLRDKIIESLKSSGKIDSSNWRQTDKYINDAKVQQWLKQVKELDKKWNKLLDNLSRFKGTQSYRRDTNSSDKDIWLDDVPYPREIKGIQSDIEIIGFLKGSMKNKDSISQWNPGMSEIGLFQISYKRNGVYQSILVRANSEEQAKQKLLNNLNGVDIIGVNSHPSPHFHEPILDSKMKDDGYYYLLRDAIDLLTKPGAARGWSQPYLEEVQEYMIQKGINPTNVNQWKKKYESLTKDSSIKDEWSGIRSNGVIFNYSDGKYTITHKNGKVETFPGNKFNTVEELFKYIDNIKDSAIKDMPLMFKSNVNMQSLKSNIDNVKNKPNETYINSLNANIQGIIADIEEIKGYEKEGKFNESPALKFSCKNLTAQYYKLLNDPKLQGTLHKLDVPTYKNVLYAEHQAQMLSQVTLK